jgi:hypothetical protein
MLALLSRIDKKKEMTERRKYPQEDQTSEWKGKRGRPGWVGGKVGEKVGRRQI